MLQIVRGLWASFVVFGLWLRKDTGLQVGGWIPNETKMGVFSIPEYALLLREMTHKRLNFRESSRGKKKEKRLCSLANQSKNKDIIYLITNETTLFLSTNHSLTHMQK